MSLPQNWDYGGVSSGSGDAEKSMGKNMQRTSEVLDTKHQL